MQRKINHCGDCFHWMNHHECNREHWKDGRWYGPSCGGIICDKFITREDAKKQYEQSLKENNNAV